MSSSERTSPQPDAEADVEAKTPLPPSPPSILDDLTPSDGLGLSRKRGRELSQEPSTPKPDDIDADPMDQRDRRAPAKRNRMQTIGDDDEQQRISPPRSPPHSPVSLSSSPRHESNLRHMNRGVRKLNMREGSRRRADTRDSRSSRERDNRSSGSGSPRPEDDEDPKSAEPGVASGRQSPAKGEDATRTSVDAAIVPTGSPPAHVLLTPPGEPETMEEDPALLKAPQPDVVGDVPIDSSATVSEDDAIVSTMEHEATVPLSAADVPHSSEVKHDPPARTGTPERNTLYGASNVFNKRLRSEEAEEVGRPRSPPPPKATTLVAPTKSFGFAAFSTNPMQVKAAEPSIWGDSKSSSASFGAPKSSGTWTTSAAGSENKPSGFSAWVSHSSSSPFASVTSTTTTTTTTTTTPETATATSSKFPPTFSYKPSISPFAMLKSNDKHEKPVLSTRSVPGGGFGQFSNTKRFGSPVPKLRALTPDGSASSSLERKKNGSPEEANDSLSDDASNDAQGGFAARLAEGGGEAGDEDNEKKLNLTKQDLITGEEDEDTIYQTRAKLYSMFGQETWKEKGTGMLKLNVRKLDGTSARLVMRSEGVHRVILNEPMFFGMHFSLNDRRVTFAVPRPAGFLRYSMRFSSIKIATEVAEVLQANVPQNKTVDDETTTTATNDDAAQSPQSVEV